MQKYYETLHFRHLENTVTWTCFVKKKKEKNSSVVTSLGKHKPGEW